MMGKPMPNTAVVIVNWNNVKDTIACVKSLQRSHAPVHIIVVDNGSHLSDRQILGNISGITLLCNSENLGFGRGNNVGMRWALNNTACRYLFLLNNDAMVREDTVSHLEDVLDSRPDAGMAAPRILLAEDHSVLWYGGGDVIWTRGIAKMPGCGGPADATPAMTERSVDFASGCAFMVRRSILEHIGGFDPRFFMYEEDVEFCLRVIRTGWTIHYFPKAIVYHKGHGSQRKSGEVYWPIQHPRNARLPFFVYHLVRNQFIVARQYARGAAMLKFLIATSTYWIAKSTQYVLHGRLDGMLAVMRGFFCACAEMGKPFANELRFTKTTMEDQPAERNEVLCRK